MFDVRLRRRESMHSCIEVQSSPRVPGRGVVCARNRADTTSRRWCAEAIRVSANQGLPWALRVLQWDRQ
jgi:hypothetical protein